MTDPTIYVAVIEAFDVKANTPRTLYFSTRLGFTSGPGDRPKNTVFEPRIRQPASIRRDMFSAGKTMGESRVAFGDLVLINNDGGLDCLLDYAFDGRRVTIYRGAPTSAFPRGFTKTLVATMDQPEVTRTDVTLRLRDRQAELNVPLQTTKYAGTNALPAGLEGVAGDLKGKPKPYLLGKVENIAPPQVNTSRLIYQVNDGAVASVDEVYDRGIKLGKSPSAWSVEAAVGTNHLYGIGWGDGLFVAVGAAGTLLTSPDGETWTSRTSSFGATDINRVHYDADIGMWVAVGEAGKIASSPDAITWTQRTSTFTASAVNDVASDGSVFVIVGDAGKAATSSDGITWTARTSGFGANNINAVSHDGATLFVCGGDSSNLATSPDGTTWTLRTTPVVTINGVGYGRGVWVVTGSQTATSPNGATWTQRPHPNDTEAAAGFQSGQIAYSELLGLFIMCGHKDYGGLVVVYTSPDAVVWTTHDPGFDVAAGEWAYGVAASDVQVAVVAQYVITQANVAILASAASYGSEVDLLDDTKAPAAGTYKAYLAGGYIRLGSPPAGLVTADVTQGASAADRTAGHLFEAVLTKLGHVSGTDWSAADVTTLDAINAAVLGYWSGTDEVMGSDVLNQIAASVGAWWGVDRTGVFRIQRFEDPAGKDPVLELTADDLKASLERVPTQDPGNGLPTYRTIVRHSRKYATQDTDLAGGVSDSRRGEIKERWREAVSTDATVQVPYLLAREQVYETLLAEADDADTEAARLQTLRGKRRDRFETALELNSETEILDFGSIVRVTHPRFGLSAGKVFVVIMVDSDVEKKTLAIGVWG